MLERTKTHWFHLNPRIVLVVTGYWLRQHGITKKLTNQKETHIDFSTRSALRKATHTTTLIRATPELLLPFLSLSVDADLSGLLTERPCRLCCCLTFVEFPLLSLSNPFSITATKDGEDWNGSGMEVCSIQSSIWFCSDY
jgi:hypothetical protein